MFEFNDAQYRRKISWGWYSYAALATNIYRKRRAILISGISVVASAAAAPLTHGVSLISTAWSLRTLYVTEQKLKLLEAEWARRGQEPLPEHPIEDVVIPILIASTVGLYTFTIDLGLAGVVVAAGLPDLEVNNHDVGTYYTALECATSKAGKSLNPSP